MFCAKSHAALVTLVSLDLIVNAQFVGMQLVFFGKTFVTVMTSPRLNA
jgi:hypothetical protein